MKEAFSSITHELLKDELDHLKLNQAIQKFQFIMERVSDIDLDKDDNRKNLRFDNGKSLGSTWAAMCLKDQIRTKMFTKGVFRSIEKVRENTSKAVQILYAGTGPYATLAILAMSHFEPAEVQFTLMEINSASLLSAKNVIEKLGFQHHVKEYLCADATKYRITSEQEFQIVISETMQRSLETEQQVPITINLMNQLPKSTILIPESVSLTAALIDSAQLNRTFKGVEEHNVLLRLDTLFEINKTTAIDYREVQSELKKKVYLNQTTIKIPSKINHFNLLAILTDITVLDDIRIKFNESGLTSPQFLQPVNCDNKISFRYQISDHPGLEYEVL